MADDNVIKFPAVVVDRVARMASALSKVLEVGDVEDPADHLTALMLVQSAIQQAIMREEGPKALSDALSRANEKRRRYKVQWRYKG